MGWWSDPVGSKTTPARASKAKPARGKVIATTKSAKPARCPVCGKTARQCTCHQVGEAIPTRRGTPKSQADRMEANGIMWCGTCNSRMHHGTCMNVTCSTRSS